MLSERLLADDMFSGWGIRTLSPGAALQPDELSQRFGVAARQRDGRDGDSRGGSAAGAVEISTGLFEAAAVHLDSGSLPELFCGFPREPKARTVPYPVACYPQAWSAASVFLLIQRFWESRCAASSIAS